MSHVTYNAFKQMIFLISNEIIKFFVKLNIFIGQILNLFISIYNNKPHRYAVIRL